MGYALTAVAVSVLGLIAIALAGPFYRVGVPLATAFTILRWGAYAGILGTAAGLAMLVWARWRGRRLGTALALVAIVTGTIAFGIPFEWQRRARSVPAIHDVTTDLDNPPPFQAVLPLRAGAPNSLERGAELASLQREGYPDLGPVTISAPPADVFARALAVAQELDWEIISADQSTGRLEAVATTAWFGFEDDVIVRLTPWGTGTRVDVRSVSRVGQSDVGTNARRIETFLDRIQDK